MHKQVGNGAQNGAVLIPEVDGVANSEWRLWHVCRVPSQQPVDVARGSHCPRPPDSLREVVGVTDALGHSLAVSAVAQSSVNQPCYSRPGNVVPCELKAT